MSQKAMVFIDGGWLYRSRMALFAKLDEDNFEIDYKKLPFLLCESVADCLDDDVSLVRTLYFATIPSSRAGFNTSKQYSFYDFLEHSCHYETDIHESASLPESRGGEDVWTKVALSSALMYYAGLPGAFDIAILVSDEPDYTPALRRARLLGRRVQVVGVHPPGGGAPIPGTSLFTKARVCDFPPLCLDDHAADLRLVRERLVRICKQCGREEETTWAGPEFFCSNCRGLHARQ